MEKTYDKIDFEILTLILKAPRITFKDLSNKLKTKNIELSEETIRKRTNKILKTAAFIPIMNWRTYGLELVVLSIKVQGGIEAKKAVIKKAKSLGSFLCLECFGAADILALFTIKKNTEIPDIIDELKNLKEIKAISFSIITGQHVLQENMFR